MDNGRHWHCLPHRPYAHNDIGSRQSNEMIAHACCSTCRLSDDEYVDYELKRLLSEEERIGLMMGRLKGWMNVLCTNSSVFRNYSANQFNIQSGWGNIWFAGKYTLSRTILIANMAVKRKRENQQQCFNYIIKITFKLYKHVWVCVCVCFDDSPHSCEVNIFPIIFYCMILMHKMQELVLGIRCCLHACCLKRVADIKWHGHKRWNATATAAAAT